MMDENNLNRNVKKFNNLVYIGLFGSVIDLCIIFVLSRSSFSSYLFYVSPRYLRQTNYIMKDWFFFFNIGIIILFFIILYVGLWKSERNE